MVGVLLMSHGKMAEGMLNSCKLFFGDDIKRIKTLCLLETDNPEEFDVRIVSALKELDDGSGVIAMCDLLGGTPSNRSVHILSEGHRMRVITGMNLAILIELLSTRLTVENMDDIDLKSLIKIGKSSIVDLEEVMKDM